VADGTMLIITIVGLVTALLTAFMAFAQTDIKKVLAYSTVGQLGFMFVALGSGNPSAAMFHLMTHAFFKALLFLGSGSVIIGTHHNQEMSKLGGLWKKMPVTGTTFLVGSLALAGVAPLAGFWSKDEILHATGTHWGAWAAILLGFAAVCTAFYTTRLFIRTFMGPPQDEHVHEHARETSVSMTFPLVFLAALALVAGFVVFNGVGKAIGFPGGITEFVFGSEGPERYHINWSVAGGSMILAGSGIFFGAWIYWNGSLARSTRLAEWNPGLYALIQRKFYFDDLYQAMIDRGVLGFSYVVSWFDRYVVNDTGVDGTAQVTGYGGYLLKFLQSGKLPNYALGIAMGVVGLAFAGLLMRA
jgi:NADH-quinone oxidoreductase subunit L